MRKVIFAFASVPPRVGNVSRIVDTLSRQTLIPNEILLVYPHEFQRFCSAELSNELESDPRLTIFRNCTDVGPLTKFLGALEYIEQCGNDDIWLIVGDDDIDYNETFVDDIVTRLEHDHA